MELSLTPDELLDYTYAQLKNFYPDSKELPKSKNARESFATCLDRVDECFKHITIRGYKNSNGGGLLNHLHSDQYSQYLYFLSNQFFHDGIDEDVCRKLLGLNRALNGIFISYKLDMPPHFLFGHPLGTIVGNASYGDCLVLYQGVTINSGADGTGKFIPEIGKGCFFGAGAKVMGVEPIGDRVSVGVDAVVYNKAIPSDSLVLNRTGVTEVIKRTSKDCFAQQFFDIEL